MPLVQSLLPLSIEHYLQGELQSELKHEYLEGQVYVMVGASINHNRISRNLLTQISAILSDSCEIFSSNLLVKTGVNRFRYPDLVAFCESTQGDQQFIDNPLLIIESLSKSTRQQDKGMKRNEYLSLPSLQEYVLVEQDFIEVEVLRRSQSWKSENYYLGNRFKLNSLQIELSVLDIYHKVTNTDMLDYLTSLSFNQNE
ncbi:Uma2 family endonuclease [Thiothrix eikelboomii]|uniref:Uma2 family endonuclease n=1 Tax=Thiothrix eikelboomii TaxID=92487 RepID=UPI003BAE6559